MRVRVMVSVRVGVRVTWPGLAGLAGSGRARPRRTGAGVGPRPRRAGAGVGLRPRRGTLHAVVVVVLATTREHAEPWGRRSKLLRKTVLLPLRR